MNLKDWMTETGTTQLSLALRIGVTQGLIWQWVNGKARVPAERAVQLERATDGKVTRAELRPDLFEHAA